MFLGCSTSCCDADTSGCKRRQQPLTESPWHGSFLLWKVRRGFNNTLKLSEEEDQENQISQWSYGAYLSSCCGHCSMWIKKLCVLQPVWTEERFLLKLQQPPPLLLYQSWAKCKSQACWREAPSGWQSLAMEEKNCSVLSNWTAQGLRGIWQVPSQLWQWLVLWFGASCLFNHCIAACARIKAKSMHI